MCRGAEKAAEALAAAAGGWKQQGQCGVKCSSLRCIVRAPGPGALAQNLLTALLGVIDEHMHGLDTVLHALPASPPSACVYGEPNSVKSLLWQQHALEAAITVRWQTQQLHMHCHSD